MASPEQECPAPVGCDGSRRATGAATRRGELALPPSLAGPAARHRRPCAARTWRRRLHDPARTPGSRPAARAPRPPTARERASARPDLDARRALPPAAGRTLGTTSNPPAFSGGWPRRPGSSLHVGAAGRPGGRAMGCGAGRRKRRRGLLDARRGGAGWAAPEAAPPRGRALEPRLGAARQERERVEVTLLVDGPPNAEVHVRLARDRVGALSDRADACAFPDLVAALHGDRAELQQRHRVAVTRADRQRATARGNGPGERHGPAQSARAPTRRPHRLRRSPDAALPAYGSDPKTKGRSTGPSIGHVHACAPHGNSSANSVLKTTTSRRDRRTSFVVGGV